VILDKQTQRKSRWRFAPVAASTLAVIMVLGLVAGASLAQQPQASSDYQLFVPLVSKGPAVLFKDNFEGGTGNWTPYLQWKHLEPGQWHWDQNGGYGGSAGYTFHYSAHGATKYAEDAITMALIQGSEGWTDYRVRSKLSVRSGDRVGLWVRGTYKQSDNNGQWFTGYYCVITARHIHDRDRIHLLQMRTDDEPSTTPPGKPWNLYHFANPKELVSADLDLDLRHDHWYEMVVEVRGPHIKCYIQDAAGASTPESVQANSIEYTDTVGSIFKTGTVGFKVYGTDGGFAALTYDDVIVEPLD
jgi:hypothetical protein